MILLLLLHFLVGAVTTLSLSLTLSTSHLLHPCLLTFLGGGPQFSKVAAAGHRTAEAALGRISRALHGPQQTTDTQNTAEVGGRKTERESESVTAERLMPRTACEGSIRDRPMTVEQPHWYS